MQDERYSRDAANTVTETDPADILDQAATVLETNGWCQNEWWAGYQEGPSASPWEPGKACCLSTALAVAMGQPSRSVSLHMLMGERAAAVALADHLALRFPAQLLEWNDHPSRTLEQVVTAMRDTAAALRAVA